MASSIVLVLVLVASLLAIDIDDARAELPTVSTDTTFEPGAYIVDMGQSADPSIDLLPYGLIYELIVNQQIPVSWAIRSDKVKDGTVDEIDFSVGGTDYRGGAFIIPAEFVAEALPTITAYQSLGVKIDGPVAGFDAPLFSAVTAWPNAVLDLKNGGIASAYYANAGIPSTAYREGLPSDLSDCDDIYVMPHADPAWSTHSNLVPFNADGGYIWAACHAVSVLEQVDDPASADPAPDMNFLSVDGLIDFGDHDGGDGDYAYNASEGGDPIFQFLGRIDSATENGSEQIYLPESGGWRPSSKVLVWDDNHPEVPTPSPGEAAKLVYGRGFGEESNGLVMYEGGHSHNKGDDADIVAAQRAFFNLHLLAGIERGIKVDVTSPATIGGGETVPVSATIESGSHDYDWSWTSSCGGSFADPTGSGAGDPVAVATTFSAPDGAGDCTIRLSVSDTCGRASFGASTSEIVEFVDLGLTKVDDVDPAEAGTSITYTLTVTNAGPSDATNTRVSDTLPSEVSYVSAVPSQGVCLFLGATVECDVGTVTTSAPVTILLTVDIDPSASGTITNNASVSSDQAETNPLDNTASEDTLTGAIGLTLDKTANPDFIDAANAPAIVTYTFIVGNDGPNDLTSVVMNDDQCSPVVRQADQTGNDDDVLEPGELWEYTCDASVGADTTNTADVTADDPLLGSITVFDSAAVDVIAPSISIAKNPATQAAPENGEAVFDIVVTNDGDVDLVDVFVTDALAPSCDRFLRSLPVGADFTYSCSLTVGAAGTSGTNTIDVTAKDPGGDDITAQDTADWTVVASDLAITKTNDATGKLVPGDPITYTIEVDAATTQNDIVVTDVLPAGINWVSTTVNRQIPLVVDDFSRDVENPYPSGWQEWNDNSPAERAGGDIKFDGCSALSPADPNRPNTTDCKVLLTKGDKGIYQSIDLAGATTATVTFDWATLENDNDGGESFDLAVWDSGAWQTVATYPLATTGIPTSFTTESETFDPSALSGAIADGRIGFITASGNDDKDDVHIDNVTITWPGGEITDPFLEPNKKDYYFGWGDDGGIPGQTFGGDVQVVQTSDGSKCNTNDECAVFLTKNDSDLFFPSDLTGVTSATVTFDWATITNDADGGESFDLVVWNGVAWVPVPGASYPLATSGLPTGFSTESATFDLSTLGGDVAAGRIGFRTASGNDDKDDIYIDNVTISVEADVAGNPSPNLITAVDDVDVAAGGTVTITVEAVVDPSLTAFYPLDQVNTASATSNETTTPVQAASAVQVVVPGVALIKTADPTAVSPGDPVTYTFVVTNTGNDPVTPTLTDPDCSPITLVSGDTSNPGVLDLLETWTYECTTTAPVATNTATVNAVDSLGNPLAPVEDSASVDIIDSAIAVTKTATPLMVRSGETASYTYEVTTGASAESLTSVFVSDDSCAPVNPATIGGVNLGDTNTDGSLDPGETWLFGCEASLSTTTTNTATAEGVDRASRTLTATDTATVEVLDPRIAIDKTKLAPADPVPAGATVTYGFAVTNPGNGPLSGVAVTDNLCSPVAFVGGDAANPGFLDPGETWSYTCDAVVSVDTLNVAGVVGTDALGGTVSADDELFVDVQGAELSLGKTTDPGVVRVGEPATYVYKVFNSGDTTFPDFAGTGVVSDDKCSPLVRVTPDLAGNSDINLEPGESWGYECTAIITADVTNTFNAQGVDNLGNTVVGQPATAFVAALDPAMDVVKTADQAVVTAGTPVTYTYELSHTGTIATIFNFITVTGISDDKCAPLTFVGGDADGDGQLGFDIDPLSPTFGDPETWTYTCTSIINSTLTNTVTATGNDTVGNPIPDAVDTATVLVSNPDFTVVKTAGSAADGDVHYIDAAGPVTYTYVVDNTGDDPLTNVGLVDDPACAPITLISGDTANMGVLDVDETWTYVCTQSVSADVTNTITVTADDLTGTPVVRTDSAVVDLVAPSATIAKTAYVGQDSGASCPGAETVTADPGDDLTYCFVVTNTGEMHLDDVAVADTDLGITEADMTLVGTTPIAPGASVTYWYETSVGGSLVNTADLTANPTSGAGDDLPGLSDVSDSDTATVVEANPSLSLEKTVYAGADAGASCPGVDTELVGAGQALVYCFEVTNTGDTYLDSVTFDDATLGLSGASLTLVSGTLPLAPTATAVYFTAATAGPTDVVNTASASATPTDAAGSPFVDVDAPTSAPDSATVDVVNPALTIDKTVYPGSDGGASCAGLESIPAIAGATVTYCFEVTNTGDVDVDDIVIADADVDLSALSPDPSTVSPLAPGSSQMFFVEATVAGSLVNTASVSATPVDGAGAPVPGAAAPTDDDTAEVVEVSPSVTIDKSAYIGQDSGASCPGAETTTGDPGDDLTYCFVVTNTGDTHLDGIVVSDLDLDIPATFVVAPDPATVFLAPTESQTFYFETTVSGDLIPNTASVTANPTDAGGADLPGVPDAADDDTANVDEVNPALTIAKTVTVDTGTCPGVEVLPVGAGQALTYCFLVTNSGDTYVDDLVIDDPALGGPLAVLPDPSTLAPIAPGASRTFTFAATAGTSDLVNTATASATPTDAAGSPFVDVDAAVSGPDSATVDVVNPAIDVAKTVFLGSDAGASCAGDESVAALSGATVTYCFEVTNTGDVDVDDIVIADADVDLSALSPDPSTLSPLAPGSSQMFFVESIVAGDLLNTASVSATPVDGAGDPVPGAAAPTDDDTALVDEIAPAVVIDKSAFIGADGGTSCPGAETTTGDPADALTYCFVVTNTGDTYLDAVSIDDADLGITQANMTQVGTTPIAPLGSVSFFYETTVGAVGDLLNTASVTANPTDAGGADLPGAVDVTDDDTATVDEVNPALTIAKTVTVDTGTCPGVEVLPVGAGQALTYCFLVTNSGDTYVDDLVIDDPALGGPLAVLPDPSTLAPIAPGGSVTFRFAATAGTSDLVNTATASATPTDAAGSPFVDVDAAVSGPDSATVDVVNPAIDIAKTVAWGAGASCPGAESIPAANGDTVTYCFEVTNTGDVDVDDIVIADADVDLSALSPDPSTLSPLAPGSSQMFFVESIVAGDLLNTASVSATPVDGAGDPVPGAAAPTDDDTAAVDEVAPQVAIAKTVYAGHDAGASCGGADLIQSDLANAVTYCFVVTNTGDTHLDAVSIDDPDLGITEADMTALGGDPLPLAPGGSVAVFYETTFEQVNAGAVFLNTAGVSANPTSAAGVDLPNLDDATGSDSASVEATDPAIAVAKTVYLGHDTGASCAGGELARGGAGAAITYCFEVTNTGGTYLDSIALDDADLGITDADMTPLGGTTPLAPAAVATFFYETTVTGDLVNSADATATATDSDGTPTGQPDPTASDTAEVDEPSPAASLDKTVYAGHDAGAGCDGDPTIAGGSGLEITFCFTLTNDGDTHLDSISIDDPTLGITDADMTLGVGTFPLAPNASATWYYETTADGDVTNVATATANATEADGSDIPSVPDVEDDGTAEVDETSVGIDLAKSVYAGHTAGAGCPGGNTQFVGAGQAVTYCFEVTNTSELPTFLDQVSIDDSDLGIDQADMTLGAGTFPLAPGDTAVFYFETTATADLVNTADASANPVDSGGTDLPGLTPPTAQSQAEVDVVDPAIEVAKTVYWGADSGASCAGDETVPAANGDTVTYCFEVTNTGDVDLDDIVITDLDLDVSGISPDPATLPALTPGSSQMFFVESTVDGDLLNTASVSATPVDPTGVPVPGAVDPVDQDTAEVDELAPAVSVEKSVYVGVDAGASCAGADVVVADPGDPLVYCFEVTNTGDTYLDDITLSDPVLGITQIDMLLFGSTPIAPGGSVTYAYTSTVAGDLANTVDVSANPTDPAGVDLANIDDPTDADFVLVDEVRPSLEIVKTVGAGATCPGVDSLLVGEGQAVTYCFEVTNTGDVDLDDVVIDDPALGGVLAVVPDPSTIAPIAPAGSVTFSFAAVAGPDDLVNTASASAVPVDGAGVPFPDVDTPTSAPDTASLDVVDPAIEVAKTVYWGADSGASCAGDETVPAANGDTVTYCFEVTNTGDVDLDDIVITDLDLDVSGISPDPATLPALTPGSSQMFFVESTVDGDLLNTASVSATPVDPTGVPVPGAVDPVDQDTAEVDELAPAVSVEKSVYVGVDAGASCAGADVVVADPGDPLVYCFEVTNTGDTYLDDITLSDPVLGITQADMTLGSGTQPLAPGAAAVWFYETTVAGDLVNTVDVSANPTDPAGVDLANMDDPISSDTAEVDEVNPSLDLAKSVYTDHDGGASCSGDETVLAGSGAAVTYCFEVTNTGDTHLDSIAIDDVDLGITEADLLLGGGTFPLPPGSVATWYYETSVSGDLVNSATASAVPTDPTGVAFTDVDEPVSEPDTATVDEVAPGIAIVKTAYPGHDAGAGCPGDIVIEAGTNLDVTFCFEVTNTGDTFLADLTVDDPVLGISDAQMTAMAGDETALLAPGASITLFFETVVDGALDNTATARAQPTDENGVAVFGAVVAPATGGASVEGSGAVITTLTAVPQAAALPRTGTNVLDLLPGALGLLFLGLAMVVVAERRRRTLVR